MIRSISKAIFEPHDVTFILEVKECVGTLNPEESNLLDCALPKSKSICNAGKIATVNCSDTPRKRKHDDSNDIC